MNHKEEDINIDMNSYDDIYYSDVKVIPNEENQLEKKYYKILELEYGSDFSSIKKAYKRLLKKYQVLTNQRMMLRNIWVQLIIEMLVK